MSAFSLSARSLQRLDGVHPRLVEIVKLAIQRTAVDFTVVEGLRTPERQRELVAQGASQTQNSLHLQQQDGYGHAVDLAPLVGGAIPWNDWEQFRRLADVVKACAAALGTPVEWGGDWKSLKDGPHFQLPRGWKAAA
ncbi:M15 family metallopeptidase [Achromobacter xylosoxidans]|uniref:M15 family metallopeptidase n=1 Tax=Alcaligenes xylosoxydans xylosoxydans TaxID=85698 RepID=UPI0006C09C88|nr:M15 family metallopeptidase [Achromobacter xylosoxidans]QQE57347.1 M15 family metallopeptidase [Achromobacter xylosoxidans]QQV16986.1 M15 family metallopeptidase [Achromobacter xylosoxidans]CUI50389.1 Peptidoglycan L-alanyl-D-glutamate endopeptidase CwlK precursor [Achromobacter xylosoxidans]